jgi:hypothetical protein
MMINEDTLTLYYYKDGLTDNERKQIESAMRNDAGLAADYEVLCRQLDQWREVESQAAPSHLKARWHDSIDRAARFEAAPPKAAKPGSFHFLSFAWGGALAATLALGVALGVFFSGSETAPPVEEIPIEVMHSSIVPASFTRGLQVHLQDSQWEIASLPVGASTDNTVLLMQIIEQNRMFERVAEQNNSPKVARVLRAFEPILMRLASDDIAPEDAEALRAQLAFELNVMLTKLARDPSKEAHTT